MSEKVILIGNTPLDELQVINDGLKITQQYLFDHPELANNLINAICLACGSPRRLLTQAEYDEWKIQQAGLDSPAGPGPEGPIHFEDCL